jgi:hypothetical protein
MTILVMFYGMGDFIRIVLGWKMAGESGDL